MKRFPMKNLSCIFKDLNFFFKYDQFNDYGTSTHFTQLSLYQIIKLRKFQFVVPLKSYKTCF